MATGTAGYSGTPLARKLGFKARDRVYLDRAPADYRKLVAPLPDGVAFVREPSPTTDIAHVFVTRREDLAARLARLRETLRSDATLWVSWPKQSSKVPTAVDENVIRDVALPLGFVDIKVCAFDATWSALKLVVRRELRS